MARAKSNPPTNRLAQVRKSKDLSQAQLAELVGSHWITISKLERGVMQMTDTWRNRLAEAMQIDPWELVAEAAPLPHAHIEGRLNADGSIDDITMENMAFRLDTDYFTSPAFRWIEVADDGYYPWYQKGDLICIMQLGEDEIKTHEGRLCIAWYMNEQGVEDATIGIIEKSTGLRRATIQRIGHPPMRDIELTSISVLVMSVY